MVELLAPVRRPARPGRAPAPARRARRPDVRTAAANPADAPMVSRRPDSVAAALSGGRGTTSELVSDTTSKLSRTATGRDRRGRHRRGDDADGDQRAQGHDQRSTPPTRSQATPGERRRPTWRRRLGRAGLAYLFSRLCVLLGAAIVAAELGADRAQAEGRLPRRPVRRSALRRAGSRRARSARSSTCSRRGTAHWYLRIIRHGYPRHVQPHVDVQRRRRPRRVLPRLPEAGARRRHRAAGWRRVRRARRQLRPRLRRHLADRSDRPAALRRRPSPRRRWC